MAKKKIIARRPHVGTRRMTLSFSPAFHKRLAAQALSEGISVSAWLESVATRELDALERKERGDN